jgi:competence protein ComEC
MRSQPLLEARQYGLLTPVWTGIIAGTALQLQQPQLMAPEAYGLAVAAALALGLAVRLASRRGLPGWLRPVGVCCVCAILAWSACGLRACAFAGTALEDGLEGRDIAVTGVVAAMPQQSEEGARLLLAVEAAQLGGQPVTLPALVMVGWYSAQAAAPPEALRAGERWRMTLRLRKPHGNRNPYGFDYELWLWEQGIQATGYVRSDAPGPQRLATTWRHPVEQARQAVRDAVFAQVSDRRLAGIVAALLVGDQAAIERADWDVFRATGVAHLMSISGLHITLFAWVMAAVVGWLWRRSDRLGTSLCLRWPAPSAGLVGGLLLAAAYAVFSGWGVPAQRTVWMLATVTQLRLSGRRWPWPQVWLLACGVVVLADPWALLQAGFWLSFVAVGVLFAADPQGGQDASAPAGWRGRLRAAMREQWLITLALTPLSLLLFGQVSLVGLAANALAIPCVTWVVTPLVMAGVFLPALWTAAAAVLQALAAVLGGLAALPGAAVHLPAAPFVFAAAAVVGGLLLALRLPPAWRFAGVPLLLPALLWQPPRPAPGEFELLAADVGQGNAVIVRTAHHSLVYDAGPRLGRDSDAGHRVLVPLLRALGEEVDLLLLSHRDADHTGGAAAVLAKQPQARLVSSLEAGHPLLAGREPMRCLAGQSWDWDGVRLEVLQPQAPDYDAGLRPNGLSCVLRIAATRATGAATATGAASAAATPTVALLVGDIEAPQELRLVREGAPLRADLLLVPHHGSRTSSTPAFLDAVSPRVALVQAGYRNRFGHPAPQVAARYAERGIVLVESARCGAARWESARPDAVGCERARDPRYWQHRIQ